MVSITETIAMARPPEEVFSFAGDYRNDPRWRTGVEEMRLEPEVLGLGTTSHEVMRFMGRRMVTTAEIVGYEPGREIAFRVVRDRSRPRGTGGSLPIRGARG